MYLCAIGLVSSLAMSTELTLTGDILPARENPKSLFEPVRSYLADGLTFGQLETCISDKGRPRRDVLTPMRVPPSHLSALTYGEIDVVSFAGNNNLDYGTQAFRDTIDRLRSNNIAVVGGGDTIEAARAPRYVEHDGVTIAFVSACSILRQGYEATASQPGINPLEIYTFYQPNENIREQPGTPARTFTVPDHTDREAVMDSIQTAAENADVTIASFHWGVHFCHDLAMYQPELAYDAIDAGADLVVGHHPHVLQGIDHYRNAPIFYSLGNFAFRMPAADTVQSGSNSYKSYYGLDPTTSPVSPETMVVRCNLTEDGIESTFVRPGLINNRRQPILLSPDDEKFGEVTEFITELSAPYGTALTETETGELAVSMDQSTVINTPSLVKDRFVSYPSGFVLPAHNLPDPT